MFSFEQFIKIIIFVAKSKFISIYLE